MKIIKLITSASILFCTALTACDSDNYTEMIEGTGTPVATQIPETFDIGMSKQHICLGNRSECFYIDDVDFESDKWTLSSILFAKKSMFVDSVKAYVIDVDGSIPFTTTAGWLDIDYSDKHMIIRANERFWPDDYWNWPQYRYARLVFEHSGAVDTLYCQQESDMPNGWTRFVSFNPESVVMPAKGGSIEVIADFMYCLITNITIDEVEHSYPNPDFHEFWDIYAPEIESNTSKQYVHEWLTVERCRDGINPCSFWMTLEPNTTGVDRKFTITFRHPGPGAYRFTTFEGLQLAE